MRKTHRLFGLCGAFALLVFWAGPVGAQAQKEVCNDGIDNDGDKLIDCADPDCSTDSACQKKTACTPGFWKNHPELWTQCCTAERPCSKLLSDLSARGPGSEAIRNDAAAFIEACAGHLCSGGGEFTDSGLFRRGDSNDSGRVDIFDAVFTLQWLFGGGRAPAGVCPDAADVNDDGSVDVSDAVVTLQNLFLGPSAVATPGFECGDDPTSDDLGDCNSQGSCDSE
jgi:hypothetical protein